MFLESGRDGFVEYGKAFEHEGMVYFECNKKHESPWSWEIWKIDPVSMQSEFVTQGANPAIYGGILYFDRWNERGRFDVVTRPV